MSLGHPVSLVTVLCVVCEYKRATKYRSLLRKMTYKDKGSDESLLPSISSYCVACRVLRIEKSSDYFEMENISCSTIFGVP